jgi:prephenate dehydratase
VTQLSHNNTLGTLGPAFSFHDILRRKNLVDKPVCYFNNFDAIFLALKNGHIQSALVAVKNSIHGDVAKNAEMIVDSNFRVIKNYELPISLHLATKTAIELNDVKMIFAHPVAWNECQIFLGKIGANHIVSTSNSQAILDLKKNPDTHLGAISGREAIDQSGLTICAEDIHDQEPNITTFSLITKID